MSDPQIIYCFISIFPYNLIYSLASEVFPFMLYIYDDLFYIQPYAFNQHTGSISSALTASESDGSLLIEQYAPCPYCTTVLHHTDSLPHTSSNSTTVHYFNMEDCVLAAAEKEHITCPSHPKEPVPLQELVPELFMTDFPSR